MAITRTAWIDDDGSGTTGTVINNAEKTLLYDQIDAALVDVSSGNVEGLTVAAAGNVALSTTEMTHILNCTVASAAAITWSGGANVPGERVIVLGRGAGPITIAHGGSIFNIATSAPTSVALNGSADYVRTAAGWILQTHDQGAWLTAPFSAANYFSGGGGGTWTVGAGDVGAMAYRLSGRTVSLNYTINTSTVAGTVSNLAIGGGVWGNFVPSKTADSVGNYYDGTGGVGFTRVATDSMLRLFRGFIFTAGNWPATTDTTYVSGLAVFEVN